MSKYSKISFVIIYLASSFCFFISSISFGVFLTWWQTEKIRMLAHDSQQKVSNGTKKILCDNTCIFNKDNDVWSMLQANFQRIYICLFSFQKNMVNNIFFCFYYNNYYILLFIWHCTAYKVCCVEIHILDLQQNIFYSHQIHERELLLNTSLLQS